ncbi:MAG: hypothetical protein KDA84_15350, partial [Planctomycetaceae bacterium]|nr:hypothetical protein [Planctomycetaceae bacterium]
KWGRVVGYRRGFVEEITLRADVFLESGEELLAVSPIRRVKLTHLKKHVEALANCPLLARLEGLNLRDGGLGLARLKTFLQSPWIGEIQEFDFGFNGLAASSFLELIQTKSLGPLRGLSLDSSKASGVGIRELLGSHLVDHLEKFELRSSGLTDEDLIRLADCPKLANLKQLHLDFNRDITNLGVRRLLESPHLTSLEVLSFRECPVGEDNMNFAFPPEIAMSNLVHLNLEGTRFRAEGIRQLAETSWVDGLVRLDLRENFGKGPMFDPLLEPGRLPHLRSLSLAWNGLDHRIVNRLASLGSSRLTELDLGADVGNEGAKLLAQSEEFANLNILNLRGSGITNPGAQALADSEVLNRITELRLSPGASDAPWNKTPGISADITK